jgi:hypothetical protein
MMMAMIDDGDDEGEGVRQKRTRTDTAECRQTVDVVFDSALRFALLVSSDWIGIGRVLFLYSR